MPQVRSALGTIGIDQIERVTDDEIKSLDHIMHVEVPALRRRAAPVHSRAPTAAEGAARADAAGERRSDVEGGGGGDAEGAGASRAPRDSPPQPDRHGSSNSATNA